MKINIIVCAKDSLKTNMNVFAGGTADKTLQVINSAHGCTMLLDEAYQLMPLDASRDFGGEAIDTLMGTIEGVRTQRIVDRRTSSPGTRRT
jgi:hypothetical protein